MSCKTEKGTGGGVSSNSSAASQCARCFIMNKVTTAPISVPIRIMNNVDFTGVTFVPSNWRVALERVAFNRFHSLRP